MQNHAGHMPGSCMGLSCTQYLFMKFRIFTYILLLFLAALALGVFISPPVFVRADTPVLKIEPVSHPDPTLAPQSAKSLTFTKVKMTAVGGDVVITNMVIQNTGTASDGVYSKVGFTGTPEYISSQGLNSVGQYETDNTKIKTITLKDGATMDVSLYADMASDLSAYNGQQASLGLVRVETDAVIEGALPIVGTSHTINSSIALGTMTIAKGPSDPGVAQALEISTTKQIFTAAKISVGSNDAVTVTSIKWSGLGSIAPDDVANVKTYIVYKNSVTEHAVSLSSNQKDYTSSISPGLTIGKGEIAEAYIAGDIVSGSGRNLQFKLLGSSVKGTSASYGYTVKGSSSFTGSAHTISSGTLTVAPANLFSFQGEPRMGDVVFSVKGEAIDISTFDIRPVSESVSGVSIWDSRGNRIAGPANPSPDGLIHFDGRWRVSPGITVYYLTSYHGGDFYGAFNVTGTGVSSGRTTTIRELGNPPESYTIPNEP